MLDSLQFLKALVYLQSSSYCTDSFVCDMVVLETAECQRVRDERTNLFVQGTFGLSTETQYLIMHVSLSVSEVEDYFLYGCYALNVF